MKHRHILPPALLALLSSAPAAVAEESSLFTKGSSALTLGGVYAFPFLASEEKLSTGTLGYSYYFADAWAISPQIRGLFAETQDYDTFGADFSLLLKWHVYRGERLSIYVQAGGGTGYTDKRLPPTDGTRFNFVPQGAVGLTYLLKENLHLVIACEYLHYSNAGLQGADRHGGVNAIGPMIGLMWTF